MVAREIIASNGVRVRIFDDRIQPAKAEEIKREAWRTAMRIAKRIEQEKGERTNDEPEAERRIRDPEK